MENPIGIIGAMDVEVELLKENMAAEGAVETSHTRAALVFHPAPYRARLSSSHSATSAW